MGETEAPPIPCVRSLIPKTERAETGLNANSSSQPQDLRRCQDCMDPGHLQRHFCSVPKSQLKMSRAPLLN